jgi:phosphoenolpyruvate synthase/pyruvate phosphate dikinase
MRHWAEQLSERMRVNPKFILSCTPSEIKNYWLHQKLPPTKILKARFVSSGIIFDRLENKVFVGRTVERIEKLLQGRPDKKEIKGQTAYGGLVKGNARIIFNPTVHSARVFQKGDILITGMTRPEFLPLMRKAGAVVTDAGGILSHAAITAREMKIPTVIGTTVATKIFKDGDMVEVDATHGVVRILKSQ